MNAGVFLNSQAIHGIENETECGPAPIWIAVVEIQDFRS
jgi:hypothetical protein